MPHLRSLHEGEELVRRILDAVPGGVVHFAKDGTLRGANGEALRILGCAFEEIATRPMADWECASIEEDGSPCPVSACPVAQVLATGEPSGPKTVGFLRRDGTRAWVVYRAVPVHDAAGNLDGAIGTFLDITERKRAEEELRRSEEKWRAIAENIPDFVVVVDREGTILQVNRSRPGSTETAIVSRCIFDYVEESRRPDYVRCFERAVETRQPLRLETLAPGNERTPAWYEVVFVPLEAERVLIVARDMTDRKRTEDAVRASEQRWRALVDNLPDAVIVADRDYRILSVNKGDREFADEEVLGARADRYVDPSMLADWRRAFDAAVETGSPVRLDVRAQRAPGELAWFESIFVPLRQEGEVRRVMIVARDVTEQKRAQDATRASEKKWRALVDSLPDSVVVVDRERRILSTNRRDPASDREPVIGVSCDAFVDEMLEEWRRRFAQVLETKAPVRYEGRARNASGVANWYESILVPLEEDGEVARVMIVARDITERRAMLAGLAEKERLASMGMVAASVAHEIMNPLTYVLANLDFALGSRHADEARWTRALAEAREGAKRMQQIVWDLRSLGRVGGEELFYVDARSVLETALRLSGPEVGRAARVVLELQEVPGVLASESRLCQVFINLLVNAAQAMEDRPLPDREIHVRTRHDDAQGLVGVEISDRGVGIAHERLDRIFEPFYTTKRTGTGLGLSISRDIIQRMGGRIDVDSTPGRGTTFTVWLSTTRAPAAGAAE